MEGKTISIEIDSLRAQQAASLHTFSTFCRTETSSKET
jgi:hypothetical protein